MELGVESDVLRDVALPDGTAVIAEVPLQPARLFGRQMPGEPRDHERLERLANLEVVRDLFRRDRTDDDALLGGDGDQSVSLEPLERRVDGRLAHLQALSELPFRQQRPRRQGAGEDPALQLRVGPVLERYRASVRRRWTRRTRSGEKPRSSWAGHRGLVFELGPR